MKKNLSPILTPTILVILGVTGDLAAKKILPALFNLYIKGTLPEKFKIVGFGRREFNQDSFKEYVEGILTKAPAAKLKKFLSLLIYKHGMFDQAKDWQVLGQELDVVEQGWGASVNRLFYLSVPPEIYEMIFTHLKSSGLSDRPTDQGEVRVLVEKPFGKDFDSAEKLDELLGSLFTENKIYRIDHYLAKEMAQNFLAFRFLNDVFEQGWNNKFIQDIEIRLWETLGVETRGSFYDGVGALRDVGQNHLLQLLAMMTMDKPSELSTKGIHTQRARLLHQLKIWSKDEAAKKSFRAQYNGFKNIDGVRSDSDTETYFKIEAEIDNDRWRGVPIIMEAGKRLHEQRKELVVTYRHPDDCFCPPGKHYRNRIVFSIEPTEGIKIEIWAKRPGFEWELDKRSIDFELRSTKDRIQYVEEYEKLLLDCVTGDQTLFVTTEEVKAMWRFTDPFVEAWRENLTSLEAYEPDTDEATIKAQNQLS